MPPTLKSPLIDGPAVIVGSAAARAGIATRTSTAIAVAGRASRRGSHARKPRALTAARRPGDLPWCAGLRGIHSPCSPNASSLPSAASQTAGPIPSSVRYNAAPLAKLGASEHSPPVESGLGRIPQGVAAATRDTLRAVSALGCEFPLMQAPLGRGAAARAGRRGVAGRRPRHAGRVVDRAAGAPRADPHDRARHGSPVLREPRARLRTGRAA